MPRHKRQRGNRQAKAVFVIACEDSKSTPSYLVALFRLYADYVTPVFAKRGVNRTAPEQVVRRAVIRRKELAGSGQHDQAWAIIDAEPQAGRARREQIQKARELALRERVELAVSNPCIEHWIHLHLQDVDGGHGSSRDAVNAFAVSWQRKCGCGYLKGRSDLARIVSEKSVSQAVDRAKVQHGLREYDYPERCSPCITEMYKLVDALASLA